MTLSDRKWGLILGLALLTFGCEEPGEIGLDLNPENGAFVARYIEVPLDNSIVQHEDVLSINTTRIDQITQNIARDGRLLVGAYSSSEMGTFYSQAFSNMYFARFGFTAQDFIYDSLLFFIRVDYLYGNNFVGEKAISVHELTEEIDLNTQYLTKDFNSFNPQPVGTFRFDVSSKDTITVDTVFSTRMSDELGLRLFEKAGQDSITYFDNRAFRQFFKGFAFVPDASNDMVAGIHAESNSTFMRMYFHDAKDTTFLDFVIDGYTQDTTIVGSDTTFQLVNLTRYYNNITLDRTGTAIEGIPGFYTEFQTSDPYTYIQGSSGIFTKIELANYFNFLDTVPSLVINRAEIIMPVKAFNKFLQPSGGFEMYVTDQTNKFIPSVQTDTTRIVYASEGTLSYREYKDEKRGELVGDVTEFIQDLTRGASSSRQLLIGQAGMYLSVISVNQTVIEKENILLKVYYSAL